MVFLLSLLLGCNNGPPGDWVGGQYQFYTLTVQDSCLDGAMEILFMPAGPATESAFEYPVFIPDPSQTPISYEVDFRAPFLGMPVTMNSTDTGLGFSGSVMDSVLLNEGNYGDCAATMSIDAEFYASTDGIVTGDAHVGVSNLRGSENRCPTLDSDPCAVELEVRADLVEAADTP